MAKKEYGHDVAFGPDGKARVKVTDTTPSRAARRTESVPAGNYVKDGLGSRLLDAALRKVKK